MFTLTNRKQIKTILRNCLSPSRTSKILKQNNTSYLEDCKPKAILMCSQEMVNQCTLHKGHFGNTQQNYKSVCLFTQHSHFQSYPQYKFRRRHKHISTRLSFSASFTIANTGCDLQVPRQDGSCIYRADVRAATDFQFTIKGKRKVYE